MRRKISFRPNLVESRQCALVRKKEKRRLVDYSLDTGPPNPKKSIRGSFRGILSLELVKNYPIIASAHA